MQTFQIIEPPQIAVTVPAVARQSLTVMPAAIPNVELLEHGPQQIGVAENLIQALVITDDLYKRERFYFVLGLPEKTTVSTGFELSTAEYMSELVITLPEAVDISDEITAAQFETVEYVVCPLPESVEAFAGIQADTATITLLVDPVDSGTTDGAGTFTWDTFRTVTAYHNDAETIFLYWSIGGMKVSEDRIYTFPLLTDVTITAHFLATDYVQHDPPIALPEYVELTSVQTDNGQGTIIEYI